MWLRVLRWSWEAKGRYYYDTLYKFVNFTRINKKENEKSLREIG